MDVAELLVELYGRVPPIAHEAVADLTPEQLAAAPSAGTNPVGWLVWHLARVQDHHVAELLDVPQVWDDDGWAERFGLPAGADDTGYGHSADEVASVRPESASVVTGYLDAVWDRTKAYLAGLAAADLDAVVDERWDPPVTLGVRLVSIADDDLQHAGQAAYARGLLDR